MGSRLAKLGRVINVHEAKTNLSELLRRVERGEEVVLARAGTPVAKLVPYHTAAEPRRPGRWAGQVWIAPDFDDTPDELVELFDGDSA